MNVLLLWSEMVPQIIYCSCTHILSTRQENVMFKKTKLMNKKIINKINNWIKL